MISTANTGLEGEELATDIPGTPKTSVGLAHISVVVRVALMQAETCGGLPALRISHRIHSPSAVSPIASKR